MFRIVNNLRTLTIEPFANLTHVQAVRWRKPRWVPVAKSRMFRVPQRKVSPRDEYEELKRLFNQYRTQIKSIRRFLTYRYNTKYLASDDTEYQRKLFEDDLKACMDLNEKWNANQKQLREARVAEELEQQIAFAKNRIIEEQNKNVQNFEVTEEIVRKTKQESLHFITPENIDAAIENALSNPVDHNFAIDLEGNITYGRDTVAKVKAST